MTQHRTALAGTIFNVQSPQHPSAGRYVRQAVRRGFRIAFQAAWPNSAGWVALAAPQSIGVDLIVRYYRDRTFTVQVCDPRRTLSEFLPDESPPDGHHADGDTAVA
ncbi:MAG: hypothetical protein WD875_08925 [Pirellulales bacterium]